MPVNLDSDPRNADWTKQSLDASVTTRAQFDAWCERGDTTAEQYLTSPAGQNLLAGGKAPTFILNYARDLGLITDEALTAGACGSTSLPLGDQGEAWSASSARQAMSGAAEMQRFHFWQMPDSNPDAASSYKLPFGTPSGGGHAVWRGVTAAAAALQGARGGVQGVDEAAVKPKINAYYAKARSKYQDDSITPPWEGAAVKPSEAFQADLDATGVVWVASIDDPTLGGFHLAEDILHIEVEERETLERVTADLAAAAPVKVEGRGWKADPLLFLDEMTRDGRILAAKNAGEGWDGPSWTDTPKSLMAQLQNPETGGHALAVLAGTMPGTDIQLKAKRVLASGRFNDDEQGQQVADYVANGSLTGISVDLAPQRWQIEINPEEDGGILFFSKDDPEPGDDSPIVISQSVDDVVVRFTSYEIIGATLVPTPAFGDAQVSLAADANGVQHRIARPGIGGVYVRFRTSERGWPVPVGIVAGGYVTPAEEEGDGFDLPEALQPHSVDEFGRMVDALDKARLAGLLDERLARAVFAAALRRLG